MFTAVLTRGVGGHRAGAFFSAIAVFMIARTAIHLGPATALVRMVAHARAQHRAGDAARLLRIAAVPVTLCATVIGLGTTLVLLIGVDSVVGSRESANDLAVMAAALPFAVLVELLAATGRGLGSMGPTTAIAQFGISALRLLLVTAAVALGTDGLPLAVAWALPFVLLWPVSALWVRRLVATARTDDHPVELWAPVSERRMRRELWTFAGFRGVAGVLQQGVRWIDIPLVAMLASPATAGVYAVVSRLVNAGLIALRGLGLAIGPQVSRLLVRGQSELAREQYRIATTWSIVTSFPVFLLLVWYPRQILGLFGDEIRTGATALIIVGCASLVNVATGPIGVVLLMEGHVRLNLVVATTSLALNVGLNLALIPRHGIVGAAAAWAISITFQNVTPLVRLWRTDRYHPFGLPFAIAAAGSLGTYGVVGVAIPTILGLPEPARLWAFVGVASAAYLAGLCAYRHQLHLHTLTAVTWRRP